jgi:hypothetical protein
MKPEDVTRDNFCDVVGQIGEWADMTPLEVAFGCFAVGLRQIKELNGETQLTMECAVAIGKCCLDEIGTHVGRAQVSEQIREALESIGTVVPEVEH